MTRAGRAGETDREGHSRARALSGERVVHPRRRVEEAHDPCLASPPSPAMEALRRARRAWERANPQLVLFSFPLTAEGEHPAALRTP